MSRRARNRLLAAYAQLVAATEHKVGLMPERLKTLRTDPPFTRAVSAESDARAAVEAAARDYCRAIRGEL